MCVRAYKYLSNCCAKLSLSKTRLIHLLLIEEAENTIKINLIFLSF